MERDLVCVVLAAGLGTRLRPLTDLRAKPLCPVDNVLLLDAAIARARDIAGDIAVNVHAHREQMVEHLGDAFEVSVEEQAPLGTAGAIGKLLPWIDGRDVAIVNADSWHEQDLLPMIAGWTRESVRLVVVRDPERADFGEDRYAGAAFMPFGSIRDLAPVPCGLSETVWEPWRRRGRLELRRSDGAFFDCGTPAEYHAANMYASGGRTVVGAGARVFGKADRCVLWPGVTVGEDEHLVDAIRARDDVTVFVEAVRP